MIPHNNLSCTMSERADLFRVIGFISQAGIAFSSSSTHLSRSGSSVTFFFLLHLQDLFEGKEKK